MFQGIWPAMFTPVDNEGNPAFGELEKITDCLIRDGVDGLYLLGSTGQGVLFKEAQRKKILEVVQDVNAERVPIMVQVGSMTTRDSKALACHAENAGADAISSVGPVYFPGGADMVLTHYRDIAQTTQLPFFPYQLGSTSIKGDINDFIRALLDMPQVQGMKLTTTDLIQISTIHNYAGDRLKLFSGADELLCHSSLCGTVGAIGSFYNFWYKECAHVRNTFINGDFELAKDFMLEFQRTIFEVLPNVWTFFRAAMKLKYQVDIGPAVRPVGNNNQKWEVGEVQQIMDRIEEVAKVKAEVEVKAKV
ncbi:dihydrodipicolinate synthase family protein [Membranicola marinus]|uniref:Dihydrodipicolinate synthase family protein n=1 Tax=Membranihabitans marinus TaxID=1227546 RepID=A0A953HJD5_9BACT|nr:dihydrodipicolinate synthase family protein [Membranihabitans marinus]MBY5956949.1 dihydrodipicolinate synthase family protein [Membranihabitans marinus]